MLVLRFSDSLIIGMIIKSKDIPIFPGCQGHGIFEGSRAEASVASHSLGEKCSQDGGQMICVSLKLLNV